MESGGVKTAICGAYFGCQTPDDRHGEWNERMYQTLHQEQSVLRSMGYRIVFLADFNAHVGNDPSTGIVGNNPDVNPNGTRFLDFLHRTSMRHIKGMRHLSSGFWSRQRGHSKSVLDYGVISEEHLPSVVSMLVYSDGYFGGGSDHNWLFLVLSDKFLNSGG